MGNSRISVTPGSDHYKRYLDIAAWALYMTSSVTYAQHRHKKHRMAHSQTTDSNLRPLYTNIYVVNLNIRSNG